MLCAAVRLVVQLLTHLPMPPGAEYEAGAMRSQLAHLLLMRPRTHSELTSSLRSFDDELAPAEEIQAVIDSVAVRQPATARGAADLYVLKEGLEHTYSAVFPHLSMEDHQHALERLETIERERARRDAAASPTGGASPAAGEAAAAAAAATLPPLPPCHPCFLPLRGLAMWPPVSHLVRSLALHALRRSGGGAGEAAAPRRAEEADVWETLEHGVRLLALSLLALGEEEAAPHAGGGGAGGLASAAAPAFFRALCWAPAAADGAEEGPAGAESCRSLLGALEELRFRADAPPAAALTHAVPAFGAAGAGELGEGLSGSGGGGGVRLSRLGLRDLRWVLRAVAERNPDCATLLQSVQRRCAERAAGTGGGAGGEPGSSPDAQQEKLLRQRRRAQAKQKAMAAMARQRDAFEAAMALEEEASAESVGPPPEDSWRPSTDGDEAMSRDASPAVAAAAKAAAEQEVSSCILCHGADESGEMDMVGLALVRPSTVRYAGCAQTPLPESAIARCGWPADDWTLQQCGHAMHLSCWTQCWARFVALRADGAFSAERHLLCPLCRALSNAVVPLRPMSAGAILAAAGAVPDAHPATDGEDASRTDMSLGLHEPLAAAARWLASGLPRALDGLSDADMPSVGNGARHASLDGVSTSEVGALLECLQRLNARLNPGQPLPSMVLQLLVRAWRAVAFSASTALVASDVASAVGGAISGGASTTPQRELQALRGLQLRPVLLQYALAREYQLVPAADMPPGPKWQLLAEQAVQLVEALLSGRPLSLAQARLLGSQEADCLSKDCSRCEENVAAYTLWPCGHTCLCLACAAEPAEQEPKCALCGVAARAQTRTHAPSSSLLWCDLHEVLAILVAILPPPTPSNAHAMAQLIGIAAAGQALLRACDPPPTPLAQLEQIASATPDPSLDARAAAWRSQLASELGLPIGTTAPNGAALAAAVDDAVAHFNRFARAVLACLWPVPPAGSAEWRLASASELLGSEPARAQLAKWAAQAAGKWFGAPALPAAADATNTTEFEPETFPRHVVATRPCAPWHTLARAAPTLAHMPTLYLFRMPKDFNTLSAMLHAKPCANCLEPPPETALCLVCGTILCAGFLCKRSMPGTTPGEAACSGHAKLCGSGSGLFYMVHEGRVMLVDAGQASYFPSIYLDEHGEEDHKLRRGQPLYLNTKRQAELYHLWLTHGVPTEVARAHDGPRAF